MTTNRLSSTRLARMHDVLNGYVEREELDGFVTLVSRGGDVHVDCVGYARDAIFRMASMTKPVTAAAAITFIEEGAIRLDDPIERWVPELADPRVLRSIDASVEDTVPVQRAITVRDLLTFTLGTGLVVAMQGDYPIQVAMARAGLDIVKRRELPADEYLRRLSSLPLIHQPGETWTYNTGSEVLAILLARAAGKSIGDLMRERIFEPLGMSDTGFSVPAIKQARLPAGYAPYPEGFESGADGLHSTADDWLSFARMLLHHGTLDGRRLLARTSVEAMTTDQLSAEQKARSPWSPGFWDNRGWGWGVMVITRRFDGASTPGQYGWHGGWGTLWRTDPREDLILVLMTQVDGMSQGGPPLIFDDFLTLAYAALE